MEIMSSTSMAKIEDVKKELFADVMKGDWEKVIRRYEDPRAQKLKISRSGYTALHVAVSNGEEDVVERLVEVIVRSSTNGSEALRLGNERGQTALHFAAAMGNLKMCKCIANADRSLIGSRNCRGETPLFRAVRYGQREAFFCLNAMCSPEREAAYSYCRRTEDGQTILHRAIFGEDFELALEIIRLHKDLVNLVDVEGLSPLHTLASKPSCFRSGTNLGRWRKIIYNCIHIDQSEIKPLGANETIPEAEASQSYPENYQVFINFIRFMKNAVRVVTTIGLKRTRTETDIETDIENLGQGHTDHIGSQSFRGSQGDFNPANNYATCFEFGRFLYRAILVIFGYGHLPIDEIREEKKKHLWAVQVVDELLKHSTMYDNEDPGAHPLKGQEDDSHEVLKLSPMHNNGDPGAHPPMGQEDGRHEITSSNNKEKKDQKSARLETKETAILVAAKNGVSEIVKRILQYFPVAILDVDKDRKNILLLAAENRQLEVFKLALKRSATRIYVTQKADNQGDTALHFAARHNTNKLWHIPGAALQMQWEIKWYKFVEKSMPPTFSVRPNRKGETPGEIFFETHKELVKHGSKWLTTTSTACSVVATLIATVAFASSTTFPGGTDDKSGKPTLENRPTFNLFLISSLVALCTSVTSLIMFLAILTSRHHQKDFGTDLPRKILVGLTSLFISIVAMLISFCSGHFFVLEDELKKAALLVYIVTFLPISFFAAAQFPLYVDLVHATFWIPF